MNYTDTAVIEAIRTLGRKYTRTTGREVTIRMICDLTGLKRSAVDDSISRLIEKGVVKVNRQTVQTSGRSARTFRLVHMGRWGRQKLERL